MATMTPTAQAAPVAPPPAPAVAAHVLGEDGSIPKTPKQVLYELLSMNLAHERPTFTTTKIGGQSHRPIFESKCTIKGWAKPTDDDVQPVILQKAGRGHSKKLAEHRACQLVLNELKMVPNIQWPEERMNPHFIRNLYDYSDLDAVAAPLPATATTATATTAIPRGTTTAPAPAPAPTITIAPLPAPAAHLNFNFRLPGLQEETDGEKEQGDSSDDEPMQVVAKKNRRPKPPPLPSVDFLRPLVKEEKGWWELGMDPPK